MHALFTFYLAMHPPVTTIKYQTFLFRREKSQSTNVGYDKKERDLATTTVLNNREI